MKNNYVLGRAYDNELLILDRTSINSKSTFKSKTEASKYRKGLNSWWKKATVYKLVRVK